MKAVISCTADEKYSLFIPLATWAWNKLGVGVILFLPESCKSDAKIQLGLNCMNYGYKENDHYYFDMPQHKEATAAQCVRLYGAALDLPDDEVLVTSDIDMLTFGNIWNEIQDGNVHIIGADLLSPEMNQYPLCYLAMSVKAWRGVMKMQYGAWTGNQNDPLTLETKTYQQCLDETVGVIECESFRGNQWSLDQFTAYQQIEKAKDGYTVFKHMRARMPERFANNRIDRDDAFWEERLSPDIIDYHMHRPGYTFENFDKILKVIRYFYPNDNLDWLITYHSEYLKLMK